jgi:hypothetical protein
VDKLDREIGEIGESMLKLVEEAVSRRALNRGEPAVVEGKQKKKKRQSRGAGGQL